MILSGPEIRRARAAGEISIEPFDSSEVNPNSYNFRLGDDLKRLAADRAVDEFLLGTGEGFLLEPGYLYLATTLERIGSEKKVMTLLGRSSVGRLGIFLNATADLGHVGSVSNWTLELSVVQPVIVYAGMRIGQVAFWEATGPQRQYQGKYLGDRLPEECKDDDLKRGAHREE